ncbi:MAG TPA: oligopeptidase A [Candidatus Competibacteraceae bacterium]|nr:oligopeptidase A [Candidatus Competibacteraceae bacterium]
MANPLLDAGDLPPFSAIRPEHAEPAVDALLTENRARLELLLEAGAPYTWDNLIAPIEAMEDRLSRAWSPVNHLNAVMNSDAWRAAYNACLPKLSAYYTELGQNERLYQAYRSIAEGPEYARLDAAQRKVIDDALRDFRLSGVSLPPEQKARFKQIMQRLSQLGAKFSENLLDATQGWKKHIGPAEEGRLAGLPDSARALARQSAEREGLTGWLLTLEFPSYLPVLNYADDRALREELYQAYVTRASDQGPNAGRWDNGPLMAEILALRHEAAQLVGYANYAEYSLASKMASSTAEVMDFLTDLARRSRPQAERELAEVAEFARMQDGLERLEAWDVGYYSEKLRQARYQISQEALRPYFPETRVVPGLFAVAERLYDVRIEPLPGVEVWHPEVRTYAIRDGEGELLGRFYLDLYARPNKRGGAWMDGCISRRRDRTELQRPAAYLVCNFTPPLGDDPALFTHQEVTTLFHEFGHGLHHLLTQVDYAPVAGIHGVEWDAVELPSQFMENWCWQPEALELLSGHYRSGEPLPEDLYRRLIAAKNFQSALLMVRQLEFALFDFRLHREYDPTQGARIEELLAEVRRQVAVLIPPPYNRFANSFSHIFAGGYAAGYYSYKWAEVLSADAFSLFEERGVFDPEAGAAFRREVLEVGGSRPAAESFRAFRGREPRIDALLRQCGISV